MSSTTEQVVIRRLGPDDWRTWRAVRLTSLADAPYAFGSSLVVEQEFDEATWRGRLVPSNGMTVVAYLGQQTIAAMGGYTPEWTDAVMLIAAWVHTSARGRGVGDALVAEVLAWSREQGRELVELRVADGNQPARNLFLRNGFVPTGVREPLESDPSVSTERLERTTRVARGPEA